MSTAAPKAIAEGKPQRHTVIGDVHLTHARLRRFRQHTSGLVTTCGDLGSGGSTLRLIVAGARCSIYLCRINTGLLAPEWCGCCEFIGQAVYQALFVVGGASAFGDDLGVADRVEDGGLDLFVDEVHLEIVFPVAAEGLGFGCRPRGEELPMFLGSVAHFVEVDGAVAYRVPVQGKFPIQEHCPAVADNHVLAM